MNRLLRLSRSHRLVAIRGNHEQMMMDARKGENELHIWMDCGGEKALNSYAVLNDADSLADIPDDHWDFLDNICCDYFENDSHLFVHAGAYPDMPLAEQPAYILRWETFDDPPPHESGKILVCGHTPQRDGRPRNIGHAICIDTHACGGGWLTCLECESGRIYQANYRGETRMSWADDYLA
jgi:serine/threonine protein phosphatase 1